MSVRLRCSSHTGTFIAVAVCLWTAGIRLSARADDTPYRLYPAADAATMGVSAIVWWVPALMLSSFVDADGCACQRRDVNALDRSTAGTYRPALSVVGDLGVGALASLVLAAEAVDAFTDSQASQPVESLMTDFAVIAEAWLVTGAINQIAKLAATRPRPLLYERALTDPLQRDPDNYVSFYSSHTSTAFTLGIAYAQTYAYRHPGSAARFWVYAAAVAAGSGIGLSRILAGKHFPSDVLVGAAAGTAVGWVVPWLHLHKPGTQLNVTAGPKAFALTLTLVD